MVNAKRTPGPVKAQRFRTKQKVHTAIQFTGMNGSDVVDFAKAYGADGHNGGSWVSITLPTGETFVLRRKDMLILDDSRLRSLTAAEFMEQYSVDKSHVFMKPDHYKFYEGIEQRNTQKF